MEDFLNTLQETKKCFESTTFQDNLQLSSQDRQKVCIDEKLKLAKIINSDSLLTSNLINERSRIIADKKKSYTDERRKFLDSNL